MSTKQPVFDTHIHLAVDWKNGGSGLPNSWLPSAGASFSRDWKEADINPGEEFDVVGYAFVECSNEPPEAEAKWVLGMAKDTNSKIQAVVAHIPVPEGAAAVKNFLDKLRGEDGKFPDALKGGRVVLLGNPMPPVDACLQPVYQDGLKELHAAGLHWEWCCHPTALPAVAQCCAQNPDMMFVLNHLGHNSGGNDIDTWGPALAEVAKNTNVVAKLGAIEEWKVDDPAPYLDHALKVFGPDRVMAESNWMVCEAAGDPYDCSFRLVLAACKRAGYSQTQIDQVFVDNAKRVYRL